MMRGWWKVTFEGIESPSDTSREHIAKMIEQGFTEGELMEEDDGEDNRNPMEDERMVCWDCGEESEDLDDDDLCPTCKFNREDEIDGQPDEAQEWADFDPDC